MENICFYPAGHTAALSSAVQFLKDSGCRVSRTPEDATHLLLPVPSIDAEGSILGGGPLTGILSQLPKDITIIGGNLNHPILSSYTTWDLLQNPGYVARNAHITACCALQLAMDRLPVILSELEVLVIGWGRIGKCLAHLLRQNGAHVTVAARKEADRAMLRALGYRAVDTEMLDTMPYRLIFNTVPVMLLPQCPGNGLKIDLASKLGLGGLDVVWARGLPGRYAPESSGQLIAQTVLQTVKKEETAL
jgi:dipicolinate synthase subunit A